MVGVVGDVRGRLPPVFLLWFVGLLSANLAVINILPIPPLDGGRHAHGAWSSALSGDRVSPERRAPGLPHRLASSLMALLWCWVTIARHPAARARDASTRATAARRPTSVDVGGVPVGSAEPVVVQSMTNTDTADADATAIQVAALAHAGSELVRITVNNDAAAAAVPVIRRKLDDLGIDVPLIGDFHYNGHQLLVEHPGHGAAALAKYRINPGNVGTKRRDENFATIVRGRHRARQAGAHRRQLGLARPGSADRADGRQRPLGRAASTPAR